MNNKFKIELTFLGTGTSTGVPMLSCDCEVCLSNNKKDKRLRSSVLLQINEITILIDTSPDFRYQMLRADKNNIDAVFVTHYHKDHISGLEDIRPITIKKNKQIPIFTNKETIAAIKRDFYYAFENNKPDGLMNISLYDINKKKFYFNDILITPINVLHKNLEVLGFRIGDITYITDCNFISNKELDKIYGSNILVISALQKQKHRAHFSLGEILELTKSLNIPNIYLTHIGHKMGLHKIISKELPKNVSLAYDGLKIDNYKFLN